MQTYFSKHTRIISCYWLAVNTFLYFSQGIKYAIDTTRFDAEAACWLNATLEPSYHFWYAGYILVLAFSKLLFHSIYPSILFQCVLSLCATILFYKGLKRILQHESACMSTLLVILYIPIQQWNVCLLTESIFISLVLLFIWTYSIEKNKSKWMGMFLIALTAATVRPNGGILIITCLVLFVSQHIHGTNKKQLYTIVLLFFVVSLVLLNYSTEVFYRFLFDSFKKGEIICGYSGWTVPIKNTVESNPAYGSIVKITQLFLTHPVESVQLGIYRFIALWSDLRVYYSVPHNLFTGIFLLTAYTNAFIGLLHYRRIYTGLVKITVLYAGLNSLLIMITYADWDGRFLAPLLPVIFIWSGLGMYYSIHFLKRKNTAD